jgi:RND family efflux transporter MFP subunit
VEPGQRVKAGQLLAQLDSRDYLLAAEAAKAQVTAAATNRNLSVAEYKRFSELKDQNFISGAELDRREATVKAAEAQLEQAQAQLSSQRNQTGYTKLASDVAGVVVGVEAESGQVVAAGQAIVRIAKDGPRDVVFSVPEDRVSLVTLGSSVEVRPWSGVGSLKGVVREVAASADPATRTFQIKVAMEGKEAAEALALGSTVNVIPQALSLAGVEIIKLPTSALKRDGKSTAVWVVDGASMTVKSQNVEVVSAEGNEVVIASGVSPGMLVVAAGVHVLQAGQKVTLYREKGANGGPARPANSAVAPASTAASATASK